MYMIIFAGRLFDATGQYDPSFYTAGGFIIVSAPMLVPVPLMMRAREQTVSDSVVTAVRQTDIIDDPHV